MVEGGKGEGRGGGKGEGVRKGEGGCDEIVLRALYI